MRGIRNLRSIRSAGCSSNRLCCDASETQGSVSQRYAGRVIMSPLALEGLASWSCLGMVQGQSLSGCTRMLGPEVVPVGLWSANKHDGGFREPIPYSPQGKKSPYLPMREDQREDANTALTQSCKQASPLKQAPLGRLPYLAVREGFLWGHLKAWRKGHTLPIWLPYSIVL